MTLLEDPAAAHQIRIRNTRYDISISCTCLNAWTGTWRVAWSGGSQPNPAWTGARHHGEVIEVRAVWTAAGAVAAWRAWHEERGVAV